MTEPEVFLNDRWTMYFHDPNDENWEKCSYKELCNISTPQEFVDTAAAFQGLWAKGMFFMMREHVGPMWEDEHNKNGGCLSFKIMKPDVPKAWFQLCSKLLGESIFIPEFRFIDFDKVCGASISPKKNYCILRIWVSTPDVQQVSRYELDVPAYTTVLYKPHVQHKGYEEHA